jgi:hypothetical protein
VKDGPTAVQLLMWFSVAAVFLTAWALQRDWEAVQKAEQMNPEEQAKRARLQGW